MKRLFYVMLAVVSLASCNGTKSGAPTRGDGNVEVFLTNPGVGNKAYLRFFDPDKCDYVDVDSVSASEHFFLNCNPVRDGVFSLFLGKEKEPLANIYNDSTDMKVTVEADGYTGKAKVSGSKMMAQIAEYNKATKPFFDRFKNINSRYNAALGGGYAIYVEDSVRLFDRMEMETRNELTAYSIDFMNDHKGELIELYVSAMTEPGNDKTDPEYIKTALKNYWKHVRLQDRRITLFPKTKERVMTYLSVLSGKPEHEANEIINNFLDSCEANPRMFRMVTDLMDKAFGNKLQPMKQHFIYVNALERIVASKNYSELEKEPYRHKLKLARNHLPGTRVASMDLRLPNGRRYDPTKHPKKWQVYFFYNPGCGNCSEAVRLMNSSDCVKEYEKDGELQIYAIYIGDSEEEWLKIISQPEYGNRWINLWDDKGVIEKNNIYDLGAIPMIYLVDRNKKVSVKDIAAYELCNQLWHKGKDFGENQEY
ncbi:MAG: DUF5106 domain-containing protein [Rikenellaceae bacterium]|nr:DUF5106 domain-containing protein [Rikenellaceae bacterium]